MVLNIILDTLIQLILYITSWTIFAIFLPLTITQSFISLFIYIPLTKLILRSTKTFINITQKQPRESFLNLLDNSSYDLPYQLQFPNREKQNLHFMALCSKLSYESDDLFSKVVNEKWRELKYVNFMETESVKSDKNTSRLLSLITSFFSLFPTTTSNKYRVDALAVEAKVNFIEHKDYIIATFNVDPIQLAFNGFSSGIVESKEFGEQGIFVNESLLATLGLHPKFTPTDSLYSKITNFIAKKNKKVYFTGHGVGGGLASVYTARFVNETGTGSLFSGLYTYGQPYCGNERFAKIFERYTTKNMVYRVINNFDFMPKTPLSLSNIINREDYRYQHHGNVVSLSSTKVSDKLSIFGLVNGLFGPFLYLYYKLFTEILVVPIKMTLFRLAFFYFPWIGSVANDHLISEYERNLKYAAVFDVPPNPRYIKKSHLPKDIPVITKPSIKLPSTGSDKSAEAVK